MSRKGPAYKGRNAQACKDRAHSNGQNHDNNLSLEYLHKAPSKGFNNHFVHVDEGFTESRQ